jgi:hypothetical protein
MQSKFGSNVTFRLIGKLASKSSVGGKANEILRVSIFSSRASLWRLIAVAFVELASLSAAPSARISL